MAAAQQGNQLRWHEVAVVAYVDGHTREGGPTRPRHIAVDVCRLVHKVETRNARYGDTATCMSSLHERGRRVLAPSIWPDHPSKPVSGPGGWSGKFSLIQV